MGQGRARSQHAAPVAVSGPGERRGTLRALLGCFAAAAAAPSRAIATVLTGDRRIIRVAPGTPLPSPSSAARVARSGDIVEIAAGDYRGDAAIWTQDDLTIRGTGGMARMLADGAHAEGKAIWVVKGDRTTIQHIAFHDARVPHRNGAGIRQEGAGLHVLDCIFRDNENGILTGANPRSDIVISGSEFGLNGEGSGYTHNIYVGAVRSLSVSHCHIHRARGGHGIKSRALRTQVWYCRIADEQGGESSYEVEFPNGGIAILVGNLIQQSPATQNFTLVSYGVEGLRHPLNTLHAVHNTLVNARHSGGRFFHIAAASEPAMIANNVFLGPGTPVSGQVARLLGNAFPPPEGFVDAGAGDYRPRPGARGFLTAAAPGEAHGTPLSPMHEYAHPRGLSARSGTPTEAGAFGAASAPR